MTLPIYFTNLNSFSRSVYQETNLTFIGWLRHFWTCHLEMHVATHRYHLLILLRGHVNHKVILDGMWDWHALGDEFRHPMCIHGISYINLSTLLECLLIINDFKWGPQLVIKNEIAMYRSHT